jgi:NADPH:quinone reductase-like Zn-dependent oxidoreductase
VFHALTTDLGLETPWPKPDAYVPEKANEPILIWGAASSVGQYAVQILRYYGYTNVFATASAKHHDKLRAFGAKEVFDYRDADVVYNIVNAAEKRGESGAVSLVLDCIGSMKGSCAPIAQIAKAGAKVAILLPVIVRDSSETQDPEYEMDVEKAAAWAEGVEVRGVRTHFYLEVSIPVLFILPW